MVRDGTFDRRWQLARGNMFNASARAMHMSGQPFGLGKCVPRKRKRRGGATAAFYPLRPAATTEQREREREVAREIARTFSPRPVPRAHARKHAPRATRVFRLK